MLFSTDPTLVERVITLLKDEGWGTAVSTLSGIVALISVAVGVPITLVKAAAARRSAAEAREDREKADDARDAALKAAKDAAEAQERIAAAVERMKAKDWQLTRLGYQQYQLENVSGQELYGVVMTWWKQRTEPLVWDVVHKGASLPVHIPYGANYHPTEVLVAWSDRPDGEETGRTRLAIQWE